MFCFSLTPSYSVCVHPPEMRRWFISDIFAPTAGCGAAHWHLHTAAQGAPPPHHHHTCACSPAPPTPPLLLQHRVTIHCSTAVSRY